MTHLIGQLFAGPLDIIGDIHGEIGPLHSLLGHLGYDQQGRHPQGRRLVFLGDLTDRGPDSPAVVALVKQYVDGGFAQCVLGNHDLNILLDHRKHDNGWFYGEAFHHAGELVPQVLADAATQARAIELFGSLPLALVRDDLRIVHAYWDDGMAHLAGEAASTVALYQEHYDAIEATLSGPNLDAVAKELAHQNKNPVKLLTSGPEERTVTPVEASGKLRYEKRVEWWHDYNDTYCVFGHYSIPAGAFRGTNSFCIDYGVGKRWLERRAGVTSAFTTRLAALRWPERTVVFDEGQVEELSSESPRR